MMGLKHPTKNFFQISDLKGKYLYKEYRNHIYEIATARSVPAIPKQIQQELLFRL
jgi:hypothetical protein